MSSIPTRIDDAALNRLRLGDADALETLFRAYHAKLCTYVNGYVRSPDVAEEIVQEIFLELWRRRSNLRIESNAQAYLYTAARNRALNHIKKSSREVAFGSDAREAAATSSIPADAAESAEQVAAVRAALAELPERAREVAELRWRQQLSYDEIAVVMGISVKGVENQLGRVRKVLREKLQRFLD